MITHEPGSETALLSLGFSSDCDSFCRNLVQNALREHKVVACFLGYANKYSEVIFAGSFGISRESLSNYKDFSQESAFIQTLKDGQLRFFASRDDYTAAYKRFPTVGAKSYLVLPIVYNSFVYGVIGILFELEHESNPLTKLQSELLSTIGYSMLRLGGANYAFSRLDPRQPLMADPANSQPLTKRQCEVIGLVKQGFTNREIAAAMVISVSLVKLELSIIFKKLGMNSREQLYNFKLEDVAPPPLNEVK